MPTSSSTIVKKHQHRQWAVAEKLHAVVCFKQNNNKHKTAQHIGCTTKQLRMWIKNKNELIALSSKKKVSNQCSLTMYTSDQSLILFYLGNKRKRLDGDGKTLKYIDLDSRLFAWYREKRTALASTTNVSDVRIERMTFRQLERRERPLSEELSHSCPSSKWFGLFLVRYGLSLQRPKRQQKTPLKEVHHKAASFFSFL
ncbi:unnamed protein product [Rotaria sp. Silwood2]|nr:unnamed protein product [Rotaria sp. Silwood2]